MGSRYDPRLALSPKIHVLDVCNADRRLRFRIRRRAPRIVHRPTTIYSLPLSPSLFQWVKWQQCRPRNAEGLVLGWSLQFNHGNLVHSVSIAIFRRRCFLTLISHVVERRIPINIHVFCSFIERICALLIVCNRLQQLGNLHSVMLPRSWLQRVLDRLDVEEAKVQGCRFRRLLQPVGRLIHALHPSAPPGMFNVQIAAPL